MNFSTAVEMMRDFDNLCRENTRSVLVNQFGILRDELFEKYPELRSFTWEQYTPFKNDWQEDPSQWFHVAWDNVHVNHFNADTAQEGWMEDAIGDLETILTGLGKEALRLMFGDQVRITVTQTDIKTEIFIDHE